MNDTLPDPGSRSPRPSRLSTAVLCVLAAAAALRIASTVSERGSKLLADGLVRWQPRERAAALSRTSGKPILYDFTAAWCGPCRQLDEAWKDSVIADAVNAGFVPARVVDRLREDGKNASDVDEMQRRYEVVGFPTLVAAAADGRLIEKVEGYRGRRALIEFLNKAKEAPPN